MLHPLGSREYFPRNLSLKNVCDNTEDTISLLCSREHSKVEERSANVGVLRTCRRCAEWMKFILCSRSPLSIQSSRLRRSQVSHRRKKSSRATQRRAVRERSPFCTISLSLSLSPRAAKEKGPDLMEPVAVLGLYDFSRGHKVSCNMM